MIILQIFFVAVIKCSVKICNTKVDEGTLSFSFNKSPYYVIFEYPEGVNFLDKELYTKTQQINFSRNIYRSIIKINKKNNIKYKKYICKEYEYDLLIEKGILFKFWIFKNNKINYIELLDWMPVPDFSMIFVGSLSLGILLCLILKTFFT